MSLGILPFLYLAAHLYLSMSGPQPAGAAGGKPESSSLESKDSDGRRDTSVTRPPSQSMTWKTWLSRLPAQPAALMQTSMYKRYRCWDGRLRQSLKDSVHSLVAAFLVIALVVGTVCLVLFLSIRIGQESSAAAIAARDAAREWTQSLQSRERSTEKGALNSWLVAQQASLGQVVEESLPMAIGWAEAQGHSLVKAYNLTEVLDDMKALYITILPPKACSAELQRDFMIALAAANLQAQEASTQHANISRQIGEVKLTWMLSWGIWSSCNHKPGKRGWRTGCPSKQKWSA